MHTGDLLLVREVIHRIVEVAADGTVTTQGGNRDRPGVWRPAAADVVGERFALVPGAGRVLAGLRNPMPLALLAATLTFVLVALRTAVGSLPPADSSFSSVRGADPHP